MDACLQGLNDAQKTAVTSPASVIQVLAPPGSGKTKTLTARVAYLINYAGLRPWNIIVCTFTIKAAREMRERIRSMVGDGIESKLILGTFHSVARRFLVRYGQEIGIEKNFGIADTSDSTAILKRIIARSQYTVEPRLARSRISGLKAKGTTAEQYLATSKQADQHEFACVYAEYEETLRASNLLDYDDLLLRATELLQKHPACVSSIEAVLIDEYQDTNNVQYELMTLLAHQMKRVTIVGDPDQSIYGFRSAEIQNLYRMRDRYPDTLVINLEVNYRSAGSILSTAAAIIEQDETRPDKKLQATHCVGEPPTLRHLANAHVEAQWIVGEIHRSRTLSAGLLKFNDYAILLRSAALSLSIEKALSNAGIPYQMVGGRRFFDRAEIKIVLDYLRVINHPDHNDALVRIINVPSRKIGDVTVKGLLEEAETSRSSLWRVVLDCARGNRKPRTKISTQAQKGIEIFVNLVLTSREKLLPGNGESCYLLDLISHILQKIQFEAYLKAQHKENWTERWANVEELVAQATQMTTTAMDGDEPADDALPVVEGIEQRKDTASDTLSKFLTNVALATEPERPDGEEADQVTISTIHAAKGLEWPAVFIPAVYEGSIPHSRAEDHDEERRLLYVGMTRAQALLYLSCPVKQSGQEKTTLSSFISSRSIQRFFSQKGPSMGCSTISDLARILRRACPTVTNVQAAQTLIERLEDDQYPLSRDELDGEESAWGETTVRNHKEVPTYKRRRLENSRPSQDFATSMTMQSASDYSIATTIPSASAGFTSANTHHRIMLEAQAVGQLMNAPTSKATKGAYKVAKKNDQSEAIAKHAKPTKPRAAGQGSITSFFGRSSKLVVEGTHPAAPHLPRSLSAPSSTQSAPLSDISNTIPKTLPSIPQAASQISYSRRPLNKPMCSKPKRTATDSEPQYTKYVLLSSSPVREPDHASPQRILPLPDQEDVAPAEWEQLPSPTKSSLMSASTSLSGFRPASTFHTTSMGQLNNTATGGAQKKTLGMRRSMQGWSAKPRPLPRPGNPS